MLKRFSMFSASDYVRALIREDQKRKAEEKLEALLLKGLDSGEPIEVNTAWWKKRKSSSWRGTGRKAMVGEKSRRGNKDVAVFVAAPPVFCFSPYLRCLCAHDFDF